MQIQLNVRHDAEVAPDNSRRREHVDITFPELVRQPGESDEDWRARTLEMNRKAESLSRAIVRFIENFDRLMSQGSRPLPPTPTKSKILS